MTEIAGASGFDFVVVDMEHAPLNMANVISHLRSARAAGIEAWVRIGRNDPSEIGRLLDSGAGGVVLPHVGLDMEGTILAAGACRYAPEGNRPTCTAVRGVDYGLSDFGTYAVQSNRDVMAVGLIEDASVVDRIEEVLAQCKLDAIIPGGPGDLATSLGLPGQGNHPKVLALVRRIIEAAKKHPNLKVGTYIVEPSDAARWRDFGLDFFVCSVDYRVVARAYQEVSRALRHALGN